MTRKLRPEETKLWSRVLTTVKPARGRVAPPTAGVDHDPRSGPMTLTAKALAPAPKPRPKAPPEDIEPGRRKRIIRARDDLGARLDLHGLSQDRAQAALNRFLRNAHDLGLRAVLVITGKGVTGDGILRRRTPEWLSSPDLRDVVAGFSQAAQHHGGAGALYVALKRRPAG